MDLGSDPCPSGSCIYNLGKQYHVIIKGAMVYACHSGGEDAEEIVRCTYHLRVVLRIKWHGSLSNVKILSHTPSSFSLFFPVFLLIFPLAVGSESDYLMFLENILVHVCTLLEITWLQHISLKATIETMFSHQGSYFLGL